VRKEIIIGLLSAVLFVPLVATAAPFAYISNSVTNRVSFIDTVTEQPPISPPWNVEVGTTPVGVAVNPTLPFAYVANSGENTVSVIDTTTNSVTHTVSVGTGPTGIAIDECGSYVYVANSEDSTLTVIDAETMAETTTVEVGWKPAAFGQFIAESPTSFTVCLKGSGQGKVRSINRSGIKCGTQCGADYKPGKTVQLEAIADRLLPFKSVFAGWSGACSGKATLCTVHTGSSGAFRGVTAMFIREPTIKVSTKKLGFGQVRLGATKTAKLVIRNGTRKGFKDLVIDTITLTGGAGQFSIIQDDCSGGKTLIPKAECTVKVSFHPQGLELAEGQLVILSNDPDGPKTVVVKGQGVQ
jgi:YVTN family beta-propeller protein